MWSWELSSFWKDKYNMKTKFISYYVSKKAAKNVTKIFEHVDWIACDYIKTEFMFAIMNKCNLTMGGYPLPKKVAEQCKLNISIGHLFNETKEFLPPDKVTAYPCNLKTQLSVLKLLYEEYKR